MGEASTTRAVPDPEPELAQQKVGPLILEEQAECHQPIEAAPTRPTLSGVGRQAERSDVVELAQTTAHPNGLAAQQPTTTAATVPKLHVLEHAEHARA